jgi:hypothetical protein
MVMSDGGIAPGGGEVSTMGGNSYITKGAPGAGLRLECTEPVGGDLRLIVAFRLSRDGE